MDKNIENNSIQLLNNLTHGYNNGYPWLTMDIHGYPWLSMVSYG